jgi:hypothetical protein
LGTYLQHELVLEDLRVVAGSRSVYVAAVHEGLVPRDIEDEVVPAIEGFPNQALEDARVRTGWKRDLQVFLRLQRVIERELLHEAPLILSGLPYVDLRKND